VKERKWPRREGKGVVLAGIFLLRENDCRRRNCSGGETDVGRRGLEGLDGLRRGGLSLKGNVRIDGGSEAMLVSGS